ncbi:hypothetical protein RintRC_2222 [Richelia intracellularis]|nr:hypothetical protein RintRC_2222 [Richelia intracellularis]
MWLAHFSCGVAESADDFTKFSTIYQWFQTLIHPALMQRHRYFSLNSVFIVFVGMLIT